MALKLRDHGRRWAQVQVSRRTSSTTTMPLGLGLARALKSKKSPALPGSTPQRLLHPRLALLQMHHYEGIRPWQPDLSWSLGPIIPFQDYHIWAPWVAQAKGRARGQEFAEPDRLAWDRCTTLRWPGFVCPSWFAL